MASLLQLTSKHSPVTNRNRVQPTFDKVPHRHPAAPVRGDSPRDINCVQLTPLPDRRIERHIWGTVIFRRYAMLFNQGALQYDRWQNHHGFSTVQYFKVIKRLLGTTVLCRRDEAQPTDAGDPNDFICWCRAELPGCHR